jgi:hypothetical protein
MLFFVTLGNCATSKSKVSSVLSNLNGGIIGFNVFPMFLASVNGKRPLHFWWNEPKKYTHWDFVETNVLHCKMSFENFNNLVLELTPFLQSSCLSSIRPQLEIKKIVVIMIYWFAHGINSTHMVDWFNVGALTKVCRHCKFNKNKLFSTYINILPSQHFIVRFENLISIPNILVVIDGTHITLANLPNKRITFTNDFFNRKKFYSILL